MKQNLHFCVYTNVLTYFKDVFDGTSPYRGRSRFLSQTPTIQNVTI